MTARADRRAVTSPRRHRAAIFDLDSVVVSDLSEVLIKVGTV